VRQVVEAVEAAPPENVVAALAGDGRSYKAKGDANATWEETLFGPSEHGRHRRTTAKFSIITSAANHTGVLATPPNRGMGGEKKRHRGSVGEMAAGNYIAQHKNSRWWRSPSSILSH
jgi:hypothetical protein